MAEWRYEQDEFRNFANFTTPGQEVEIIVDREVVEVQVIRGRGYMREETTAYVPVEVMVRMLEHAGFDVVRRTDDSVARREPEVG